MDSHQRRRSRRQFLRTTTTGASALVLAATGTTVGADAGTQEEDGTEEEDGTIRLNNDTFDVEVDPASSSHGWTYDGTSTLYLETYAVKEGDDSIVTGRFAEVETGYGTDEGSPGEWYGARSRVRYYDASVDRDVRLDPREPVLDCVCRVRNEDDDPIENVRFLQHVDYDVGHRSNDVGTYDESQGIYRHRQRPDGGVVAGFTGSLDPAGRGVAGTGPLIRRVQTGTLSPGGGTSQEGDVAGAMRWDLGTIEPGESVGVTVRFAAADTPARLDELLAGDLPDPERHDFVLDGRDAEQGGDQRDGSSTADGGNASNRNATSAENRSTDAANGDSGDALPGPGIVGALLGIGGGGYLLGRADED